MKAFALGHLTAGKAVLAQRSGFLTDGDAARTEGAA